MGGATELPQKLTHGADRVATWLRAQGSVAQVEMLPESTATAREAARAVGVPVARIGKSIAFAVEAATVVVVVGGDRRVSEVALARAFQVQRARRMNLDATKEATGFPVGGVSPFGLPPEVKVVLDQALADSGEFVVAAGHPRAVVRTTTSEVLRLTCCTVERVAE